MVCTNSNGTFKLPMLFIGESKNSRCFSDNTSCASLKPSDYFELLKNMNDEEERKSSKTKEKKRETALRIVEYLKVSLRKFLNYQAEDSYIDVLNTSVENIIAGLYRK